MIESKPMKSERIGLSHGAGGRQSQQLIHEIFADAFQNPHLDVINDGAVLSVESKQFVMTTDSYVVEPVFFPGGDIGKLAVCGTVNDLACMGARPMYMSTGFILEEGFLISDLRRIVDSMKQTSRDAEVYIVTGDTKVVPKGKADGIFINTAGVGQCISPNPVSVTELKAGDSIIITGSVGNHGMAVISARGDFNLKGRLESDVAPLNHLVSSLIRENIELHAIRDATRGGVATVLNEMASASGCDIVIEESQIPVRESVQSACQILGFDPLYVANEGVMVMALPGAQAEQAVEILRTQSYGQESAVIGEVCAAAGTHKVLLRTLIGSHRILDMRSGEQLPRIC